MKDLALGIMIFIIKLKNVWMNLLKEVEDSHLWLLSSNVLMEQNLKKEAEKRGVNKSRLTFSKKLPLDKHLARHKLGNIFLDTFNYNAHTTASDALWTGMPLITFLLPELRELSPKSKLSESYESRENFFKENKLIYFNLREILFESSEGKPSSLWVSLNDSHTNALANDIITSYMKTKLTKFLKKKCIDIN